MIYLPATLADWAGIFLIVVAAFRAMRGDAFAVHLTLGIVLMFAAAPFTQGQGGLRMPLVWVLMPAQGWVALVCAVVVLFQAKSAYLAVSASERRIRLLRMGAWLLGAVVFGAWQIFGAEATVFRGSVPLTLTSMAVVVGLLALAFVAMSWAGRSAATHKTTRAFALHAALLAGCVVFGLPFVWLLSTSFKEDRDMVNDGGIKWIPRVEVTTPYIAPDPLDRFYKTIWDGRGVRVTIDAVLAGGTVEVEVARPLSIRGRRFIAERNDLEVVPRQAPIVRIEYRGEPAMGFIATELLNGNKDILITEPAQFKGEHVEKTPAEVEYVRRIGLRWMNYVEALELMPPETNYGFAYLKNTLVIAVLSVIGTILSSSLVAYAFSRMRFPGRNVLFGILLSTMMLPAAITLLPQFLIFRQLGWIDTLLPLWAPAFLASAFNVFLLRQFFMTIPIELEDAAKIDGCTYLRTWWQVMMPQIYPALAVIAIWTFVGAWNNFMGPLIYISSPENMPIAYAVQLFHSDRSGDPGLLMAFSTMATIPVLVLFFFAQRYFIEGVQLSGLGGR